MKLGAESLVKQWGRPMEYYRGGVKLFDFKGRLVQTRPEDEQLDYSVDQAQQKIIGCVTDFITDTDEVIIPRKFDIVKYRGEDYTVQRGHTAGADEDELVKMIVLGGVT